MTKIAQQQKVRFSTTTRT